MVERVTEWLGSGEEIHLTLDTSDFDAVIPDYFREEPVLVLKFSNEYAYPVEVGEDGIKSTLEFGADGFQPVKVPWSAVYAVWSSTGQALLNMKKAKEESEKAAAEAIA